MKECRESAHRTSSLLLGLLVVLMPFVEGGMSEERNKPIREGVPEAQLLQVLEGVSPEVELNVWVLFTDKGILSEEDYEFALEKLPSVLSDRSLRRRQLRDVELDLHDLPVRREYVERIQDLGCRLRTTSRYLNAASFSAERDQIESITELPFVASIKPVMVFERQPPEVSPLGGLGRFQGTLTGQALSYGDSYGQLEQLNVIELHRYEISGAGVLVGVIDSGFDIEHETFDRIISEGRLIATRDFIEGDENVSDGPPSQLHHGTCTWSALAGYSPGLLIGPAYGAGFALAKTEIVNQEIQVEEDYWVAALEWLDSLGVDVVTSSLGYNAWYDYSDMDGNTALCTIAGDIAVSRGIVVVNSAGNEGQTSWRYIIAPADGDSVLAIGAVDRNGNKASFSSIGPTFDGRTKPDFMARGVATVCAQPDGLYGTASGTSLSAPLAAGAMALLLEVDPTLSPIELRDDLRATADRHDNPDNSYGWGIIDALSASGLSPFPQGESLSGYFYNYPNPFNTVTTINFFLLRRSPVTIQILDFSGELIRQFTLGLASTVPGENSLRWEGDNHSLSRVAPGVYLGCIATDHYSAFTKLVVMR